MALTRSARTLVAWVAGINLVGALVEGTAASIIGSVSLWADAADFLEDFLINALVVAALGWAVESRRKASYVLAGLILIPAAAALGTAIRKILVPTPPEPFALSGIGLFALVLNLVCALLLMRVRGGGALLQGAWLAARNDVLANVLIILAGVVTIWWASAWPDVVVGLVLVVINVSAAKEVFEQARAEEPELEIDED
ncbi:cation transporter [uncultured Tessaracoccus sp.]|uniref:cation transporter n=1 Tax=uncultured Tessaracoccus sp. TaxID=905023 RepID=UPI0025F156E9|nr:cation transporter [uncultured Tessaracoccus sp.]